MAGRFDWYQATVQAEVPAILAALEGVGCTSGGVRWQHLAKAPNGYGFGDRLEDADGTVATVVWGGKHALPHVIATGESAHPVAEVLRTEFRDVHRVTRADACLDFAEPGAYDSLQNVALGVAGELGIKVGTAGDHLLTKQGRTLYVGSTKSHTTLRIYEKGHELRAKFRNQPERWQGVPLELARLECQVRPKTLEAKIAAAYVDPLSLMGSTRWMREVIRRVGGIDLEPFQAGRPWRQSDDDRAYAAVLAQYGALFQRRAQEHGSWEMFGRQLGEDLAQRGAARR